MIKIEADKLGKRFNHEWIFKNFSFTFDNNQSFAITGPNGSGKSTLLQVLAGLIPQSSGNLIYSDQKIFPIDHIYKHISITTPYQELIEEFTLLEFLNFHLKFRPLRGAINGKDLAEILNLSKSLHKEIKNFSSGMKQKVKLGLSVYSNSPVIFLDEPTTNLDSKGIDWYFYEISQLMNNAILIICSNQRFEYDFCKVQLHIENFK